MRPRAPTGNPGFGENMRVLQWIVARANGQVLGAEGPLGWMPRFEDLNWMGMERFTPKQFHALMTVDRDAWVGEILSHEELFAKLYDQLPKELIFTRELILSSLWRSPEHWKIELPRRFANCGRGGRDRPGKYRARV
jgi:phosphoenolpyruvate carboxykinase (GTP)